MGLDMYLHRVTLVRTHQEEHQKPALKITGPAWTKILNTNKVDEIREEVAYWRKDNHIHRWFVENVQEGKDECQDGECTLDQLKELRNVCKQILRCKTKKKKLELAKDLLPTQTGFFFGSTEYDESYFEALDRTVNVIDSIEASHPAKDPEGVIIYYIYHSSW